MTCADSTERAALISGLRGPDGITDMESTPAIEGTDAI